MNPSPRRLVSTDLCYIPGLLAFFRAIRTNDIGPDARDRAAQIYMVGKAFPDLTVREIEDLLAGRFARDGEDVILFPPDDGRDRSVDADGNRW